MRRTGYYAMLGLAVTCAAASAGDVAAQERLPWVVEEPGGETACAFDTPYRFFHAGLSDVSDLLIYFQGGGACWEWVSCSGMFDTEATRSELSEYRGVFDPSNEANPFRDYAVVFIPYCTGDVHIGDAEVRYGDDAAARPVSHRGFKNATAALDFAERHAGSPRRVVVSGASAGSYGALFYAPDISRRFPSSDVVVLGDSGVPLLNNYEDVLLGWGSEEVLSALRGAPEPSTPAFSLVHAHAVAAEAGVGRIAQVTSDQDAIQGAFYLISGSPEWRARTYALLDSVTAQVPSFTSFVVAGSDHGLLRTDRFYEYEAGGVRLSEWVRRFVDGAAAGTTRCAECVTR